MKLKNYQAVLLTALLFIIAQVAFYLTAQGTI